jgi:hypothetical protein
MDDPQQQASDSDAPQQSFARTPALEVPRAGGSTLRVMDTEATPGQQRLDSSLTIMAHSVDMMAFSQQDTTKQFAVQVGGRVVAGWWLSSQAIRVVAVKSGYQVALAPCAAHGNAVHRSAHVHANGPQHPHMPPHLTRATLHIS